MECYLVTLLISLSTSKDFPEVVSLGISALYNKLYNTCVCSYVFSTWWCQWGWKLVCTNIKSVCRQSFFLLFVINKNFLNIHYFNNHSSLTSHFKFWNCYCVWSIINKINVLYSICCIFRKPMFCINRSLVRVKFVLSNQFMSFSWWHDSWISLQYHHYL
jgi:hypothetical protein